MPDSTKHSSHHGAFGRRITLAKLQRVKNWHAAQLGRHPVERWLWDAVVTLWVLGWTGWLPGLALDAPWAYPLCLLGVWAPRFYVQWRVRAHDTGRLRCDWLDLVR